ncbi:hypothetical protein P9281_08795 [Caballeronia sp. LP003]|uniref:hypothetical protein n=1 Tax=Caballeronia sp. LP003 TaxID=3038551 RepID=UPI00285EF24F|nr:hypothetical protein [Caballeronia sp. LP003]MDR5786640.1 hypothetical protein [Caballeronia sp. LP003]
MVIPSLGYFSCIKVALPAAAKKALELKKQGFAVALIYVTTLQANVALGGGTWRCEKGIFVTSVISSV